MSAEGSPGAELARARSVEAKAARHRGVAVTFRHSPIVATAIAGLAGAFAE